MRHTLTLYNAQAGHSAWVALWQQLKPLLLAGHRLQVEVKPATRSVQENALLHLLLTHIARRQEWAGKKRDAETWKRLIIAACEAA